MLPVEPGWGAAHVPVFGRGHGSRFKACAKASRAGGQCGKAPEKKAKEQRRMNRKDRGGGLPGMRHDPNCLRGAVAVIPRQPALGHV